MADPTSPPVPFSISPSTPNAKGFRFPGIPHPGDTIPQMQASVRALKEAVELLTGQVGDNRALVKADIKNSLPPGSSVDKPPNALQPGDYGILDRALTEFNLIFSRDLVEINTAINNSLNDAIAAFQAGDASVNGRVDTVSITLNNLGAAVTNEIFTRTANDEAFAVQISTVSAVAGGKNKVFVGDTPPTATAVGDIWIDTIHGNLMKTWDGTNWVARQDGAIAANAAAVQNETAARVNADSAMAAQISTLFSTTNSNTASIIQESATRTLQDQALAAQIDNLSATVGNQQAQITQETAARVNADDALSGQVTTATARVDNATASGSYRLLAVASSMSGVAAEFAVQLSATGGNGVFGDAGMRMQVLGTGQSRIVFNANQFIVNVNGGPATPFTIEGNSIVWGGQLHASSIFANSITSGQIAVGGILAFNIASNTITANEIAAGGIIAFNIAANTITADKIAAHTITADKIAAKTITAASAVIGDLAVDTLQVAGNAITLPFVSIGGGVGGTGPILINSGSMVVSAIPGTIVNLLVVFTFVQGYSGTASSSISIDVNGSTISNVSIQTQQNCCCVSGTYTFSSVGSDTITIQCTWSSTSANVSINNSVLSAVAFKR